jgi:antitoxin YefM
VLALTETTYTNLRRRLTVMLDQVANEGEVVMVHRRGKKIIAMIPADELPGLMETMCLLRSARNHVVYSTLCRASRQIEAVTETPHWVCGNIQLQGILRLRCCFASRNNNFAQDDKT